MRKSKEVLSAIKNAFRKLGELNISAHAAGCCYFLAISLFPSVVLVLSILRFTSIEVSDLMAILNGLIPNALMPYFERLLENAYSHSSEMTVSVSAIIAVWSASRGIYGLQRGLNAVYDVHETRNFFVAQGISIAYTFLFMAVLAVTLVLHVFGKIIIGYLPDIANPVIVFFSEVINLRLFILFCLQTMFFTGMYMELPNKRNRFRDSFPGAIVASLGWLAFSALFSVYVANFQFYSLFFGSVYAVALCLLWLFFCLSIVLYGAALNKWLFKRKRRDNS